MSPPSSSTAEAAAFGMVCDFVGFSHSFSNNVNIHGIQITFGHALQVWLIPAIIVRAPHEWICTGTHLLEWWWIFEWLNLEPSSVILLHALYLLWEVFWVILLDAVNSKRSLKFLCKCVHGIWGTKDYSGMGSKFLKHGNVLIEVSFLHSNVSKLTIGLISISKSL